jgi:hypothetical protein
VQSLTDECSDTRNIIAATEIKPDIYIWLKQMQC